MYITYGIYFKISGHLWIKLLLPFLLLQTLAESGIGAPRRYHLANFPIRSHNAKSNIFGTVKFNLIPKSETDLAVCETRYN